MPPYPRFRLRTLLLWVAFVAVACAVIRHAGVFLLASVGIVILVNAALIIVAIAGYYLCRLAGYFCRWVWERGRQDGS